MSGAGGHVPRQPWKQLRTNLSVALQGFITEAREGLEQVGLDAPGQLDGHLGAVLQDGDGKLGTRHAGQPQPEVSVNLPGREGGREEGKEGGREGRREGGREGGRKGRREGGREGLIKD